MDGRRETWDDVCEGPESIVFAEAACLARPKAIGYTNQLNYINQFEQ